MLRAIRSIFCSFAAIIAIYSSAHSGPIVFRADISGPAVYSSGEKMINPGMDFYIHVYADHQGTEARVGLAMPFSITGLSPSIVVHWGDTSNIIQPLFESFWNVYSMSYVESWDSVLPNLFAFTGAGTVGWPTGLGEIELLRFPLWVSCGYGGGDYSICIEKGYPVDYSFDWWFEEPDPGFQKVCWRILDDACSRPEFTNCPDTIRGQIGGTLEYQFTAISWNQARGASAQNPTDIYFMHLKGPGVVDTFSGYWSYYPSNLYDAWTLDTLRLYVSDPYCGGPDRCWSHNICSAVIAIAGKCGDADDNGSVNILDISKLINCLYKHELCTNPWQGRDANKDGSVNILDISYLINYLYKSGPEPDCPSWP
ncbi:exported hypothetical protein [Candidatus Zixiibacteriota bacterium]|nr:exported hypothetical protein [candidate division Zixibacteria bacterium]